MNTIAFDVYGTLVDPVEMGFHLKEILGKEATVFGELWHEKKVEYAFRRGLMNKYEDFGVCTAQALKYCLKKFDTHLSETEQKDLLAKFADLKGFGDVIHGLIALKKKGFNLVAFSNGPEAAVRTLMSNSDILPHLDGVFSCDDVKMFKPSPIVYQHMMKKTQSNTNTCWMVSSNPWDVIGAK
eukprot:TRINITY_DN143_c0_g4_i3.p1 TRINITY_DN143_c0_g4~~TRINITY_DN143_c0_g4_i3.p1  ORF type:complete len:183 (+),score=46.73 TRINITY_DN143_c0_g4_i3:181-729(+)